MYNIYLTDKLTNLEKCVLAIYLYMKFFTVSEEYQMIALYILAFVTLRCV